MGYVRRWWTRRAFLFSGIAACGAGAEPGKGTVSPSEWRRYSDPATEFEVFQLTDAAHASFLPAYYARPIARHGGFLLFSSDRAGKPQAFRMDLKSGECRQLTAAAELDGSSLTLLPDERSFCYFDGPSLRQTMLANLREREVYRVPEDWKRTTGASVSDDGVHAVCAEERQDACRLRLINRARGVAQTVVETAWPITHPMRHPRREQILYRQGDEALWLVNTDGRQNRRLKLAEGRLGPARWSPGGRSVLYLNVPDDRKQLHMIREFFPDANQDKLISKTSQFAHFGCNANASVFVGASENKASPYILLLTRGNRTELCLCEHRASDPASVAPIFAPDSHRVLFQSDRHGKPAIYSMRVDRFVEKTESDA
jgi:oligogalacturonide lyase